MKEEAKLEFTIIVNWRRKDGGIATTQLGTLDHSTCSSEAKSCVRAANFPACCTANKWWI